MSKILLIYFVLFFVLYGVTIFQTSRKKVTIYNAVFYYPAVSIIFFGISYSIDFNLWELSKEQTGLVVFSIMSLFLNLFIYLFIAKRSLTPRQEKELLRIADKRIASFILLNKMSVQFSDLRYIENSDLNIDEKKQVLTLLHEKKMNNSQEAINQIRKK